jgi:conjugal transfer/entry exclusion protein
MKTVYLATLPNDFQAQVLKNALQNEGIVSFMRNETLSSVLNFIQGFQIELLVFEKDYDKAFDIFEKGFPQLAGK